jgi:hypothetical protein
MELAKAATITNISKQDNGHKAREYFYAEKEKIKARVSVYEA